MTKSGKSKIMSLVAPHVGACVSLNTILTLLKHHLNAVLIA